MCFGGTPKIAAPQLIPATSGVEAQREADLEAALSRRRTGAAAQILTSPVGIPSGYTKRLGAPAAGA